MKIALFGGSFNPPQNGHVAVAQALLASKDFDAVWVLPSFKHPFEKKNLPFEDRVKLCHLAFDPLGTDLKISEVEKEMPDSQGFMMDTVQYLQKKFPDHSFSLVLGSDIFPETNQWKDFEKLKNCVEIYPIRRAGHEKPNSIFPFPKVSSTEVREKIKKGEDISALVPAPVLKYIRQKGFYR